MEIKLNEEEKRDREINSSTRFPNGADTILTQQGSETEVEYVEDTRRSLRPGSEFRGENEKETGQGHGRLQNSRCLQSGHGLGSDWRGSPGRRYVAVQCHPARDTGGR